MMWSFFSSTFDILDNLGYWETTLILLLLNVKLFHHQLIFPKYFDRFIYLIFFCTLTLFYYF